MKTLSLLLALFFVQQFQAQTDSTTTVKVNVENLKSNEGAVLFGLYTEGNFLKAAPKFHAKSEITNGNAEVTFENVPAGTYAVSCFQDMNSNGQMDFEPTGMPTEPYGISNNVINPYGPPEWSDAKFEVSTSPVSLTIKIE